MQKALTGRNVFDETLARLIDLYQSPHRVVISFSGGKDSTVLLELAIKAARSVGRLPIDVSMLDEEIIADRTVEYVLRVANRPEVRFHWIYDIQAYANLLDRTHPFFWTFDPLCPDQWVHPLPTIAKRIDLDNTDGRIAPSSFPHPQGVENGGDIELYQVAGVRAQESPGRLVGTVSRGGHISKQLSENGSRSVWPLYDWTTADVWRAIVENKWAYNRAYDDMLRAGVSKRHLRLGPPTMTVVGIKLLPLLAKAWPNWFAKLGTRLPSVRSALTYRDNVAYRKPAPGETWKQLYYRTCIRDAPNWIRVRAEMVVAHFEDYHSRHATAPIHETNHCSACGFICSWQRLAREMYAGDPLSLKFPFLGNTGLDEFASAHEKRIIAYGEGKGPGYPQNHQQVEQGAGTVGG